MYRIIIILRRFARKNVINRIYNIIIGNLPSAAFELAENNARVPLMYSRHN